MRFGILGPFLVTDNQGLVLRLGGPKQQAVLAILVLHAGRLVTSDRLIDELWAERAPPSAAKTVQVYISNLRKILGDGTVITRRGGYMLSADAGDIDARQFEALAAEGHRALRSGDAEQAAALVRDALGLWRGDALADFRYEPFAQGEAARLEEARLIALEDRVDADLARGEHATLVSELEALVGEHPLRERARGQLMLALYRSGRHPDALAAYQNAVAALDEIGLRPGPALRQLEDDILRHDAALRAPTPPPQTADPPDDAIPVPAAVAAACERVFVGRADEDRRARRCWKAVQDGHLRCIVLSGEPGIGKTTFALRLAGEITASGGTILAGRCPEELTAPYAAWIQALAVVVEHMNAGLLAAHIDRCGGELGRLIPALHRRAPDAPPPRASDPESERYLLFSAVSGLIGLVSENAPVVLVLDDLHWGDLGTLALLKYLIRENAECRVLVVTTHRDTDITADHALAALLADLYRGQNVQRIELKGLSSDEVVQLATKVDDEQGDVDESLVRVVAAESDGNPFFAIEMLRHMVGIGRAPAVEAGEESTEPVDYRAILPTSVQEVVYQRVHRLGSDARHAFAYAAVIGRSFDATLLARALGIDEAAVLDTLEVGVAAGVLEERPGRPGAYAFAHDLINHALYESLGATRRARIHRQLAEALEKQHGASTVEQLARHWRAAHPADPDRTATYCRQAGERALEKLAPDEAARWFEFAGEALDASQRPDRSARCDIAIGLGEAQRQAGRPEHRETLLQAAALAEDLSDAKRLARAVLANNRGFASRFGTVDLERAALLERALHLVGHSDPVRRSRLLALNAMELQFDPDYERRRMIADEALALAHANGDARSLPYVLRDHFHAIWSVDNLDARSEDTEEMAWLAATSDDPLVPIWAADRAVHVAIESGRVTAGEKHLTELRALTDRLGQPGPRWAATYYAAGLAHLRGELAEAERLAGIAADIGEDEPDMIFIYSSQLCMIRVEQDRAHEVIEALGNAAAMYPAVPAFEAGLTAALCELGRADEAAALLAPRAERRFADVPHDQIYSTALALWSVAASHLGDAAAASALYELIEPWREQFVWSGTLGCGSAEMFLGMLAATLGAHDRALEHYRAASELHAREGVVTWEVRNLTNLVRSLLATGDLADAQSAAERALSAAHAADLHQSARRIQLILQSDDLIRASSR